MDFYNNFIKLCNSIGKAPSAVAEEVPFGKSQISRWKEGGGINDATALKIANYFGITLDEFMGSNMSEEGTPLVATAQSFSQAEILTIKKIRALDEHGKKMVDYVIAEELRRMEDEAKKEAKENQRNKIIPLFGTAAAAGPGEPDTGNPFEDYEVAEESPAEFAVRISGDSMEPYLRDQEIVLCTKRRPNVGEITVVMVNGCLLCKQYIPEGRNILLRSTNRERSDCDYTIFASSQDTVRCYGTVIHDRIPLADQ